MTPPPPAGSWFESDPLWFKRAVFYEIHLRGFFDANADGSGDFRGLTEKLDYLQWLGIDVVWLLPMYASPLRDGGYDIADYKTIHPDYGTIEDVRQFIEAAHERGIRVIADLVMNHTSSDHEWFQRARSAPPGSSERDWYVWSDTVHRYEDARIIFTDTETSNWTWDEEAEYFRPNFFVNTPDILTDYLAEGGPPAFAPRLILAATISPTYGIYSGFENFEHVQRPGAEEYIDNEKFETKQRRLDGPLLPLVQRLNQIRRDNPALQRLENLQFLETQNDALVAFAKREGRNLVITVVNVDPHTAQEGLVNVPYELGVPPSFTVTDLIDLGRYDWHVGGNYVRLDPWERAGHVLHVDTP